MGTLQLVHILPTPWARLPPGPTSRDEAPGTWHPGLLLFLPTGTQLEKLMESMRNDIASTLPSRAPTPPRRGEFCMRQIRGKRRVLSHLDPSKAES